MVSGSLSLRERVRVRVTRATARPQHTLTPVGDVSDEPLSKSAVTLEQLLAGITEQNLHGEASPGDESPGSRTAPHKWG